MSFEVIVNGSGTSTGVPLVGCDCHVCTSKDNRDQRLRASLLIRSHDASGQSRHLLIDTGPDLRQQLLRLKIRHLDGLLLTHYHYDHVGGLEDLRPFGFLQSNAIPCLCDSDTLVKIKQKSGYLFDTEAGMRRKNVNLEIHTLEIRQDLPLPSRQIAGFEIEPLELIHEPYSGMRSVGYVINRKFAYLTDFKVIPEYEKYKLYNLQAIYLGAPLNKEHPTHISIKEAWAIIEKFNPEVGYVGHLAHNYSHIELEAMFPEGIFPAYDGLIISLD